MCLRMRVQRVQRVQRVHSTSAEVFVVHRASDASHAPLHPVHPVHPMHPMSPHEILTTTLPNCLPLSSRAIASAERSSEWTESMTGVSRPARNSATTASYSESLPIVEPMMVH